MNWHKPPLYPATQNRNEPGPIRGGVTSYSESSPPEEINDDVLPVYPVPTSTAHQGPPKQALSQKNVQGRPIPYQTNKMIQRPPVPNQMQYLKKTSAVPTATSCASSSSQIFDSHVGISSTAPTSLHNAHIVGGGGGGYVSGGAKIGKITADRRLGFTKLPTDQLRAHVQEILHTLNTFTLSQCHDKVYWFATVVLQQLLDLELYTACSTAVEQCVHGQQKRMQQRLLLFSTEKRKLEQEKKQLVNQRAQLTKEKTELTKCKAQLEQSVKTLTPFEAKCQTMKQEEEKLMADKQNMAKELEEMKRLNEQLNTKVDQTERERDTYKRRMVQQETGMKRRVKELEEELAAARSKSVAAEKQAPPSAATVTEGMTTTTTTTMDETKFRELKQKLKNKKAEIEQLRAELAKPKQRWDDDNNMDEQLKRSKENADKYRHRAMKLDERLRRKTEKIEEQKAQIEEAINAKRMVEDELSKVKAENALIKQQQEQNVSNLQRAVGAGQTTTSASAPDLGLLNDRIRTVTKRRKELDKALAFLGVRQPKRAKHSTTGKNVPSLSSASTSVAPVVEHCCPAVVSNDHHPIVVVVEEQGQQQQSSTTPTPNSPTIISEEQSQQQQLLNQNAVPNSPIIVEEQQSQAPNSPSITIVEEQQQPTKQTVAAATAVPATSASPPVSVVVVAAVEHQQQQQPPPSSSSHCPPSPPPPSVPCTSASPPIATSSTTTATSSIVLPSTSSTAPPAVEQQQQQPPPPPPAQQNNNSNNQPQQQQQQESAAEKLVTSFMRYIGQRPGQDGHVLVQEFVQQSAIPVQFRSLVAEQLNHIVTAARANV